MRKLGLVGYYGHGNFGDDLFLHAFRRLFPMSQYRLDLLGHSGELARKYKDRRLDTLKESYSAIIVGGGDLLIPGYDISEQYLLTEFLQVPVFIHGVGVPTWTGFDEHACEKMKQFVQSKAIKAICARDMESAEWINLNLRPQVEATYSEDIVFSLADTLTVRTRGSEIKTVGIVMRGGQHTDKCQMKKFVRSLLHGGMNVQFIMLGVGQELAYDFAAVEELDCLQHSNVDVLVRQSDGDLLHAFNDVDVVYSMKFHGCIVALMHDIPTVALITTDKFVHLYNRLDIGKFMIHHTNQQIFESVRSFHEFPTLPLNDRFQTSLNSLEHLKRNIDSVDQAESHVA